ncbi:MAG: hypothetical protein ACPLRZ_01460 [Thermovenabulum sp.]|uniref:hypothetical protein n=2 Tax=Thermovenabulum sp. TaxID=3100335 RepID=UPI003C7E60A0
MTYYRKSFYKSCKQYVYTDDNEKAEAEQEVLMHFWKVLQEIKKNPAIIECARNTDDIRSIVAKRVRNSVSPYLYRILRLEKKVVIFAEIQANTELKNIENTVLTRELKKALTSAIEDFLYNKNELEIDIFCQFITKVADEYAPREVTETLEEIAKKHAVSTITVKRHKKRLLQEFRSLLRKRLSA